MFTGKRGENYRESERHRTSEGPLEVLADQHMHVSKLPKTGVEEKQWEATGSNWTSSSQLKS